MDGKESHSRALGVNEDGLCPKELRRLVRYDESTGELWFLKRPIEYSTSEGDNRRWNRRHEGTRAFSTLNNGAYEGYLLSVPMSAARVAWALFYGCWPQGVITHKNLDRKDNRIVNLCDTPLHEQSRNQKKRKDNTSGVQGVNWNKDRGKWTASIYHNGKSKYLGIFTDKEDAIKARKKAEKDLGFGENHGLSPRVAVNTLGEKISIK